MIPAEHCGQFIGAEISPARTRGALRAETKVPVIERTRVGDYWVLKRLLMRVQTTVPIPKIGSSFDIAVNFDDYAINQGLADSLFSAAGATRGPESSR